MGAAEGRDFSRRVFGGAHRLSVSWQLRSLSEEVLSDFDEIANLVKGVPRSSLHKELGILVELGALARFEVSRAVRYQRRGHPWWELVEVLVGPRSDVASSVDG